MDILLWAERYRGKNSYHKYIPEYVDIVRIQNGITRTKEDFKIRLPINATNIDEHLVKGFNSVLSTIKSNPGCNIIYSTESDYKLMMEVYELAESELDINEHRVLFFEDFKRITKGVPASNASSRRSRATKAVELCVTGRYTVIEPVKTEEEKKPTDETGHTDTLSLRDTENRQFVRNKHYNIFHLPSCKYVKRFQESDIEKLTAAEANSYMPCKTCIKPWIDGRLTSKLKLSHDLDEKVEVTAGAIKVAKLLANKQNTVTDISIKDMLTHEQPDPIDTEELPKNTVEEEGEEQIQAEPDTLVDVPVQTEDEEVPDTIIADTEISESETKDNLAKTKITYNGIDPLGRQIINICGKYGIYCELYDTTLVILTAAGGWKFDYSKRPIVLYHQNYKNKINGVAHIEYHVQPGTYLTPLDAISYLIKHDNRRIDSMLKDIGE